MQTQTRMHSSASQRIELRDQTYVFASTTSEKRYFPLGHGWRREFGALDHPQHAALRRHKTMQHLFAYFLPTADVTCHVATVAPFLSYDVAIMELFPRYDKTEECGSDESLVTGCGPSEDNDFILNVRYSFVIPKHIK